MNDQNKLKCRLCDKDITEKNGLLLYDYDEKVETRLGRKINIILNSTDKQKNLSNYCCEFCSCKIEICFSLLVEIQASDEVIRQTYENLSNGKKVDTANQLFICGECKTRILGIKSFIKHYENHILKKTTVGSKKGRAVTSLVPYKTKEEMLDSIKNLIGICGENNMSNELTRNDVGNNSVGNNNKNNLNKAEGESEKSEAMNNEEDGGNDENDDYVNYDYDDDDDDDEDINELSSSDLNLSSIDELDDEGDDDDDDNGGGEDDEDDDILELLHENDSNDTQNNSDMNSETVQDEDIIKEIEIDSELSNDTSENSLENDASYTNLVNIVKKELQKPDSGEDDFMSLIPNEDGNYTCDACNLAFEYKFILILHLKSNHKDYSEFDITNKKKEDETSVKCCYCKKSFCQSEFKNHLLECREEYSHCRNTLCQICGKMCSFRSFEKHLAEHKKSEGWPCDLCGKKFKAERFLKSHLGEHDETKKKTCEICGKKLLPLSYFSHITKHGEKRHVCQYCGKAFTYNYGLRIHLKVHESKKNNEPKVEKKKDKVFCWVCKKEFNCAITLHRHLKSEHNSQGIEQESRFPCSHCDKKFADMFSLKAHLKLIHEMKDEDVSRLKSLPVYRYIECNVCKKVFNSENKIRIHMKQDHGLKPFEMEILKKECEKCGKRFASKQNLIHHINGAHLNIKPMTCDICQEKFAKHSSLIYHKLRHSGEKPFQCEYCQKSYRQRNDVIRHLARHVRDKELTLEEASAVNNSPSRLVLKRRIFLKDSSINYQTIIRKNRRKSEVVEVEPVLEEEINEIQEEQMEFSEEGVPDSMIYVEEVQVDENLSESPSTIQYINPKPIYNEERNTIILSSPDVLKTSFKNVTYRYVPSQLQHIPAVIVKKEDHILSQ